MVLRDIVIALGDSITWGSRGKIEGQGYPSILSTLIAKETKKVCICVNKGITAETSTGCMLRAYEIFRSYPESQLVLLLTGTNDLKSPPMPDIYSYNILQIVNMARIQNKRILVGTLPPIKTMGMWCFPRNVMDGVNLYNDILRELSQTMDFPLVDFSDMGDCLCDGVHFSQDGYCELAHRWFQGIKELI